MTYHWKHFSGIDYDAKTRTKAIFKFVGENKPGWAPDVDKELGNYDYLSVRPDSPSPTDRRPGCLRMSTSHTLMYGKTC